jgi:predicted RNA binding protein YcfA (HicA-like mRNA interferase family)
MGRLAGFSGREVGRVAELSGWVFARNRGSHRVYWKQGVVHNLSVPGHRELKEGTLRDLLATMEMTVNEFLAVARK